MERKQKIDLLKGIANGSRDLKELLVLNDPIIVDEADSRPIIEAIKSNGNTIIYSKDFDKMDAAGLIRGLVFDLRNKQIKLYHSVK